MCGISGILTNSIESRDVDAVNRMSEVLIHRGPDAQGVSQCPFGVMAHRRLSIIDIEQGQQPMHSADGRYTLVFNGEIYNYLELGQALKHRGVRLQTQSDTEVLLHYLILEQEQALNKLNGMFAFVLLDNHTGNWLAARDHFGIKPFYFAQHQNKLLFASEIKAILASGYVVPEAKQDSLEQYLTFQYVLQQDTLFRGVQKLEPGCFMRGNGGDILSQQQYWELNFAIDENHTEQYFVEQLHDLLQDSVAMQLRSDVPLGAYLSGGLDSSAVTQLAAANLTQPISVFTGKFDQFPGYDESHYAKMVAEASGATLHQTVPTAQEFVEQLPNIIYSLDEPTAGPGVFPQFMVSRDAGKQVKVILGGQGGDELFGGYARYLVGYLEQALKGAIFETQEEGKHLVSLESIVPNLPLLKQYTPMLKSFWQEGLFDSMEQRYFRLVDRSPESRKLLHNDFAQGFDKARVMQRFMAVFERNDTRSYINKMTHFDLKTLLPALLHIEDRASMAASLESRVPLLDRRIAELVASAPPGMKFSGGETKALLKKAIAALVPTPVIKRKDKMGFPVPLAEWVKAGPVREFVADTLTSQKALQRGIFSPEALRNASDFSGVGARQLWGMLCLELWYGRFIDGQPFGH